MLEAPGLTHKQKEAMKLLLLKEGEVRGEATSPADCQPVCAGSAGHWQGLCPCIFPQPDIACAATSPLIAEKVAQLLYNLRLSMFTMEESRVQMIAGVTARVIKPAYQTPFSGSSAQL
jgi:hypothetical protein